MKPCGRAISTAVLALCAGAAQSDIIATCRLESGYNHLKLEGHEPEWIPSSPGPMASPMIFHGTSTVEDCVFRSKSITDSGANDHPFRRNPITDSGAIRSVIPVGSRSLLR